MNRLMIVAAVIFWPLAASAQPSSQVAWTAEQLNFVKAGDSRKGKELAAACSACHGDSGIATMAGAPSLAGQLPTYLFKQLRDYADGSRENPVMSGFAKTLSRQDAADLAAWFGSLPPPNREADGGGKAGEALASKGDNERMLAPCEVCHGAGGEGQKMDIPALAGQRTEYTEAALAAFKNGSRHNDVYGKMRQIAGLLSDREIKELALYYQDLTR